LEVAVTARSPAGSLRRDTRAEALLEFIIAFFPILVLFLCCLEIARSAIAHIMLQRAAGIAARACAVIRNQPLHCDSTAFDREGGQTPADDSEEDRLVKLAAEDALRPFTTQFLRVDNVSCDVPFDADGGQKDNGHGASTHPKVAQSGTDTVTVDATFFCAIPVARDLLCPGGGAKRAMTATAKFGHQGARFDCWFARTVKFISPTNGYGWEPIKGIPPVSPIPGSAPFWPIDPF
jgi:hypothetical protein